MTGYFTDVHNFPGGQSNEESEGNFWSKCNHGCIFENTHVIHYIIPRYTFGYVSKITYIFCTTYRNVDLTHFLRFITKKVEIIIAFL